MASFESKIEEDRKNMLENLTGLVLDVGSGTGINFKFFNNQVRVLAIEPSLPMLKKAKAKIKNKNIELINLGVNDSKLQRIIAENSLDAIVCTLVLCTVPNPELALENFKKWLKPEGKLMVLEHIHSKSKCKAKIEDVINPVWNKMGDGCNLNRHTDKLILNKGFKPVKQSYFNLGVTIHKAVYILNTK